MKKRIAAAVLAVVLVFNIGGLYQQAKASATVATVLTIGTLAFNLIGLMTGQYDDTAEAIGCFIENGVEGWEKAFVGSPDTPSWFSQGWNDIYSTCTGWFESGDITIDENGNAILSYNQYIQLTEMLAQYGELSIDFGTVGDYAVFSYPFGSPCSFAGIEVFDSMYSTGQSYIPIYYNQTEIYFSDIYAYIQIKPPYAFGSQYCYGRAVGRPRLDGSNVFTSGDNYFSDSSDEPIKLVFQGKCFRFNSDGLSYGDNSNSLNNPLPLNTWYHYDGTNLSQINSFDNSSFTFGYLTVAGQGYDFIKTIERYSASSDTSLNDLSDTLAPILDKTTNPSLSISTDPAITNPVEATTVTDIPGEADVPLSQLMEVTDVDIDIPSIIVDKFPFCIPFDFIRVISVLAAEPKAPVFRIPISTNPENLTPFEGNQTVGNLPENYEPMFEIDEEIVIDLSCIPLVQPICYTVFIIGFVVLLIMLTPKLINH